MPGSVFEYGLEYSQDVVYAFAAESVGEFFKYKRLGSGLCYGVTGGKRRQQMRPYCQQVGAECGTFYQLAFLIELRRGDGAESDVCSCHIMYWLGIVGYII